MVTQPTTATFTTEMGCAHAPEIHTAGTDEPSSPADRTRNFNTDGRSAGIEERLPHGGAYSSTLTAY